jgi:hypothetical protein
MAVAPSIVAGTPAAQPGLLVSANLGRDAFFALLGNAPSTGSVNQIIQRPMFSDVPANLPPSSQAVPILAARSDAVFAGSQQETDDLVSADSAVDFLPGEDE